MEKNWLVGIELWTREQAHTLNAKWELQAPAPLVHSEMSSGQTSNPMLQQHVLNFYFKKVSTNWINRILFTATGSIKITLNSTRAPDSILYLTVSSLWQWLQHPGGRLLQLLKSDPEWKCSALSPQTVGHKAPTSAFSFNKAYFDLKRPVHALFSCFFCSLFQALG